jgi:hypothetical protein
MARCPAIKANGERCKGDAIPGADWCYSHDPDRAEERRRNASRGGKSGGGGRSSGELAEIKALLSELTNRVLGGEGVEALETGRAAVANQLVNTRLRAVELERKIKETDELEARIEELEQAAGH